MTVSQPDCSDEIPTLPTRSRSGRAINAIVIRAMAEQLQASKAAHDALDHLEQEVERGKKKKPSNGLAR